MIRILVGGKVFNEAAFPITSEPSVLEKRRILDGVSRDSIRLTLSASYVDVAKYFVNNAAWAIEETTVDENGTLTIRQYNKAEYSVAGDIIDHRNGSVTVYMSKPTETEMLKEAVQAVLHTLDDAMAISVASLFPEWATDVTYAASTRLRYHGVLYRVITAHTSAAGLTPDTSTDLFSAITDT